MRRGEGKLYRANRNSYTQTSIPKDAQKQVQRLGNTERAGESNVKDIQQIEKHPKACNETTQKKLTQRVLTTPITGNCSHNEG